MKEENLNREWLDVIDVYSQYFHAKCTYYDSLRRAVLVKLSAMKDIEGILAYQVSASFFPFENEEDFLVANDVYVSKIVSDGQKRRMKKSEEKLLESFREEIDSLLPQLSKDAVIFWDRPLRDARFG